MKTNIMTSSTTATNIKAHMTSSITIINIITLSITSLSKMTPI
jgi:hypothetical protein